MTMKKHVFSTLFALLITAATALAQSYNINQGSITFSKVGDDLHVLQGANDDTYVFNNGTFPTITVYGSSVVTDNIILIDTPWTSSGYETLIALSNVLIQSQAFIPIELTFNSSVKMFLAPGTSNEVKTTGIWCPGIKVSDEDGPSKLTITGSGKLVAAGGESSAGIGGYLFGNGSMINIEESATVIATGGMGGAGIGGGEATDGGTITISSNAVVVAQGGNGGLSDDGYVTIGGAAGIGGGGSSSEIGYIGGAGGTITISGNASVRAQGGEFAAGIGGGEEGFAGTISIGSNTQVIAVSDGTRPAIDDDGETLDGNGYVLIANYLDTQAAGTLTDIHYRHYTTKWVWSSLTNAAPSIDYQSIAFSFAQADTFRIFCNDTRQKHQGGLLFPVLTTGLTIFTNLVDVGGVVVTFDMNGGAGGSTEVVATFGSPMPAATAPTNSDTSVTFVGYFLADQTTKYYNADMSSARICDTNADFTLYAKWYDGRVWDGASRTYDWYTNQASPYTVSTAAQLAGLAALVNNTAPGLSRDTFSGKIVNLASDLDLANFNWTPVGDYSVNAANVFQGTFNGGAKTITRLKILTNTNYKALFGSIGSNATLSNLTVSASITASNYVGVIAGSSSGGAIHDCHVSGSVTAFRYLGGITGSSSGAIKSCTSSSAVEGDDWVGGIAGELLGGGRSQNCACSGSVKGNRSNTYAGGIIGANSGTAQNCIFSSNVTAMGSTAWIGGIAGYNSGRIMNGLMLGSLSSGTSSAKGGIAGENTSIGSITNGYFRTGAGVSKAIGTTAGAYASLGSFSSTAGALIATDNTALLYGSQLHIALNRWVNSNNGAGTLLWWTTDTGSYPSLADTRPPFTLTTPTPVPFAWLAAYYPTEPEANYETLANSVGANGFAVWESFVAGLVPTSSTSTFTASIALTNGTPFITWSPNYPDRVYTIQGKGQLSDSNWGPTNSASRFFNVNVEKP